MLTATDAADAVRRLAVVERKVVAAKAQAVRRVDGSQIWRHAGFRTAAEWMAAQTGDTVGATTGLLDTVKKLDGCRATKAAFTAGDVSVAAAREIARSRVPSPSIRQRRRRCWRWWRRGAVTASWWIGRRGCARRPVRRRMKQPVMPGCGPAVSRGPVSMPMGC